MHQEKEKERERKMNTKRIEKLEGLNDNQIIVVEERKDGTKTFDLFSYRTLIASYDTRKKDDLTITSAWDYSRTTTRALYEFITCYTWLSVKAVNGCVYNLFDLMMNAKNKKSLLTWLINSKQIKVVNVEIVEERGF